jgi:hypothetical protein
MGHRKLWLPGPGERRARPSYLFDLHDSRAIEAFTLLVFLACHLFHVFLIRNRKPQRRRTETESFWAALITAQIYGEPGKHLKLAPPGVGFFDDFRVSAFSSKATKGFPLLNP